MSNKNSIQCVKRRILPKAKISSTTHVQLLQWLHGKHQQHHIMLPWGQFACILTQIQTNLLQIDELAFLCTSIGFNWERGSQATFIRWSLKTRNQKSRQSSNHVIFQKNYKIKIYKCYCYLLKVGYNTLKHTFKLIY